MIKRNSCTEADGGTTFPEVVVAVMILAIFFASVFELNAVCLRYIDSSKESVAALQYAQDRSEVLHNLAFRDLTDASYLQNTVMASAANASFIGGAATEVVTIRAYPTADGVTKLTRAPDGTVTLVGSATSYGAEVQVDVSLSWKMILGARTRSELVTFITSDGTKK